MYETTISLNVLKTILGFFNHILFFVNFKSQAEQLMTSSSDKPLVILL